MDEEKKYDRARRPAMAKALIPERAQIWSPVPDMLPNYQCSIQTKKLKLRKGSSTSLYLSDLPRFPSKLSGTGTGHHSGRYSTPVLGGKVASAVARHVGVDMKLYTASRS